MAKDSISEFEYVATFQKNEQSIRELWNNFKWPNMCVLRVSKEEARKGQKTI